MCNQILDRTKNLKNNSMLKAKPELFKEWYFKKNNELEIDIYEVTRGSQKRAWWVCLKCNSEYESSIVNKVKNRGCPYCRGLKVNHTNSLGSLKSDLIPQWHSTKNNELSPFHVTKGSNKTVWWSCLKCNSEYKMPIVNRTFHKQGCPYCAGRKVNQTNSLSIVSPDLASEWHPTLNGNLAPEGVTSVSGKKVWWLGRCGHEWKSSVASRNGGSNCPYCSKFGTKVLKGFNDLWTTDPNIAELLANPEDGHRYMRCSTKYADWKCPCGNIIENKTLGNIYKNGLSCPVCSDGFSFGEKYIYCLLKKYNIDFIHDTTREWSVNKRYDFYLPKINWIIETHGKQHYEDTFDYRTSLEEKENDTLKENLAYENKIEKYISLDVRISSIAHIKKSILSSPIVDLIPDIDFISVGLMTSSSLVKEICEQWENGETSIINLARKFFISKSSVRRYLKRGVEIGLCKYNADHQKRSIVQLDEDMNLIKEWHSISNAAGSLKINNIAYACKGNLKTSGGFKWMYKEDYDNRERKEEILKISI